MLRNRSKKNRRGMTVVEIVMIIAIAAVVLAGIFTLTKSMFQNSGTSATETTNLSENDFISGMTDADGKPLIASTGDDNDNKEGENEDDNNNDDDNF